MVQVDQLKERIEEPQIESKGRVQETGKDERIALYHTTYWRIKGESVLKSEIP